MAASRRKDVREDILQDLRQVIADHSHISDKSPLHMAILDATQDLLKVDDKNTQMVPAVYKSHITKKLLDNTCHFTDITQIITSEQLVSK